LDYLLGGENEEIQDPDEAWQTAEYVTFKLKCVLIK
jgi:hypothetical protein